MLQEEQELSLYRHVFFAFLMLTWQQLKTAREFRKSKSALVQNPEPELSSF